MREESFKERIDKFLKENYNKVNLLCKQLCSFYKYDEEELNQIALLMISEGIRENSEEFNSSEFFILKLKDKLKNYIRGYYRKRNNELSLDEDSLLIPEQEDHDEKLRTFLEKEIIREEFKKANEKEKRAILLHEFLNLPLEKVCKIEGIHRNTVLKRKQNVYKRLRNALLE